MSVVVLRQGAMFGFVFAILVMAAGCGQEPASNGSPQVSEASHDDHDHEAGDGHDHSGWWCAEHGVPEEVCSMCSSAAAANFKEEGDWCDEHNRAESQCFLCEPSRAEKFAKLYVAKIGEQPPKPTE